jgi:hypothetical protein
MQFPLFLFFIFYFYFLFFNPPWPGAAGDGAGVPGRCVAHMAGLMGAVADAEANNGFVPFSREVQLAAAAVAQSLPLMCM